MVVDVRKPRQRDRKARADQLAQLLQVRLGLRVAPLVLALGVDHQAVCTGVDGARANLGLEDRVGPVDVLPGADPQPGRVESRHEARVELRPRACPVAALDQQRLDPVLLRRRDDRGRVAAARALKLPDPHPASGQRVAAGRRRAGGVVVEWWWSRGARRPRAARMARPAPPRRRHPCPRRAARASKSIRTAPLYSMPRQRRGKPMAGLTSCGSRVGAAGDSRLLRAGGPARDYACAAGAPPTSS